MIRTFYDAFMSIFAKKPEPNLSNSIILNNEWVAMVSEYEEKIAEKQRNKVNDDLKSLKDRSTKLTYKNLMSEITEILLPYENLINNEDTVLLTDLKMAIFRDIFTKVSPIWLDHLKDLSPEISTCWYSMEYERNILGELIAIATQFSPDTLNYIGLSQTIMSVHLSLVNSIQCLRNETLSCEESNKILKMLVSTTIKSIAELWLSTAAKSKRSIKNMGKLPSKWKIQNDQCRKPKIDVKYIEVEIDPIRRKYLLERFGIENFVEGKFIDFQYNTSNNVLNHNAKEEFLKTREVLKDALKLKNTPPTIVKKNTDNIELKPKKLSGEFLKAQKELENKLRFRMLSE